MTPIIIDDTFGYEAPPRVYTNICPALRSERHGLTIITYEPIENNHPLQYRKRNSEGYACRIL